MVPETSRPAVRFLVNVTNDRRRPMRKLSYVLAALATIAVAAPTVASAQGFSVRIGGDREFYRDHDYYGPRVSFYGHDRGWHRGWYHRYGDRDVIINREPGPRKSPDVAVARASGHPGSSLGQ